MPLLPTAAAIAGIIGCFQSAAGLFTAIHSRKEATQRHQEIQAQRAEDKAAERASKALIVGKSNVQHEYDRSFARVGPRFATGDGTIPLTAFPSQPRLTNTHQQKPAGYN
jgi:hypothetical protein